MTNWTPALRCPDDVGSVLRSSPRRCTARRMRDPTDSSAPNPWSSSPAPAEDTSSTRRSRHGCSGSSSKRYFPRQLANCLGRILRNCSIRHLVDLGPQVTVRSGRVALPASRPAIQLDGSPIAFVGISNQELKLFLALPIRKGRRERIRGSGPWSGGSTMGYRSDPRTILHPRSSLG